ncbi:MAG: glycosyltransferase family 4 protein [Bacteroidota bacterium]|nr:glycosyltransferase family 4 protein [Bacteroidota bacterium]
MRVLFIFAMDKMPKILFIAAHRSDRSPSQRYRFEQYFTFLAENGYECILSNILDERDDKVFYSPGKIFPKLTITFKSILKRLTDIYNADDYDIIFVQREAFMTGSVFFEKQFSRSKAKFVFDFDDSVWLLDTSEANKMWQWMKSSKKTGHIIELSDLVIAGNNYLADYALKFNSNVKVIPTTIDTEVFKRKQEYKNNETICIGWSGSLTTIKHFEAAVPFLKRIKDKYKEKVTFRVMGDASYKNDELGIQGIAWSSQLEVMVISKFDIGIMPLPDDEWVKGKCGLKGLSYMSLEVPTIMSAVGVNKEIINDRVNGFLAATDDEWVEKLSELIDSFELRRIIGKNARSTVETRYSVESQKYNYLNAFNDLLKEQ